MLRGSEGHLPCYVPGRLAADGAFTTGGFDTYGTASSAKSVLSDKSRKENVVSCSGSYFPGAVVHLRLLGLMASAILLVPLGRLHMREFQIWVAACGLDPVSHGARKVLVMPACTRTLHHWRALASLTQGVPVGAVLSRKVVTMDASLSGWGGVRGRCVRGSWSVVLQRSHINSWQCSSLYVASLRY